MGGLYDLIFLTVQLWSA